jgi:general secretion pathway protein D
MRRLVPIVLCLMSASPAVAAAGKARAARSAPPPRAEESGSCRRLPPGRRIVKLNLRPDTELGDLVAWIAAITCKQFILPGNIPANSKKVTIVAPQLITPEEAYDLFLAALDSMGLAVYPAGQFSRIIESHVAKSSPVPLSVQAASP